MLFQISIQDFKNLPNPTMPFSFMFQTAGFIQRFPEVSDSRYNVGSTLDGGACKDAGPATAFPETGSYMLP